MKKLFSLLILVCVFAGAAGAQTFASGTQAAPALPGSRANPAPLQFGGYGTSVPAARAGQLNTLLGLWSWTHKDILGGAVTAGLEVAGVGLFIAGMSQTRDPASADMLYVGIGGGVAALGVGMMYGYLRGTSQYTKQNAAAVGFSDNPIKHTSVVIAPDFSGNGGMTASLTYATKL